MMERVRKERDRHLRRLVLEVLRHAMSSPRGGLSGQVIADVFGGYADPSAGGGYRFEDAEHAIRLIRDLANKGYATAAVEGLRQGQRLSPDHLFARITAAGERLLDESIPVDPDVFDDRLEI